MKKMFSVVLVAALVIFSAFLAFAAEDKVVLAPAEEEVKWTPTAEMNITGRTGYLSQYSGSACYKNPLWSQAAIIGLDKGGNGFYVMAENFSPSAQEGRETDFYVGFYAEKFGVKVDAGAAFYWVREHKANDYYAVYAAVELPSPALGIVPIVKMEYDFSKKDEGEDMNGFMYFAGVKREFSLHERVKITAEVGAGGNTGLYGLTAENLAYVREKIEIEISIMKWLKLKGTALTQQNLGRQDGIAADTDRLFVYAGAVATF